MKDCTPLTECFKGMFNLFCHIITNVFILFAQIFKDATLFFREAILTLQWLFRQWTTSTHTLQMQPSTLHIPYLFKQPLPLEKRQSTVTMIKLTILKSIVSQWVFILILMCHWTYLCKCYSTLPSSQVAVLQECQLG